MTRRVLGLLAALMLVAFPAAALGEGAPAEPVSDATTHVKIHGEVAEAAEGSVTIHVFQAWRYDVASGEKTSLPDFAGQKVTAKFYDYSKVLAGGKHVDAAALVPGTEVYGRIGTYGDPSTTDDFCVIELGFEVAKEKDAGGKEKPKHKHPGVGEDHPGFGFDFGFFSRNWRMKGEVLGLDEVEGRNVINLDVRRFGRGPKKFRDEGREVVSLDSYVMVGPKVVITTRKGERITFADLKVDDRMLVIGRFRKPAKWLKDEDGEPVPTVLARRIKVMTR